MEQDKLVGRGEALEKLAQALLVKKKGRRHVFVEGRRKVGKTALLRYFKTSHPGETVLYINFEHIVSSPKLFARNFLCQVVGQVRKIEVPYAAELDELNQLVSRCDELLHCAFDPLLSILSRDKPDHEELVAAVFELPTLVAEALEKKVIVLLDNFENIFNLRSYTELKKVDKLIADTWKLHDNVSYAICGTRSSQVAALFRKSGFWQRKFQRLRIQPLDRGDTYYLAGSIFGARHRRVPREVLPTVHYYSQGIPFYIRAVCNRALSIAGKETVNQSVMNKAFILEVLRDDGLIFSVCHSIFSDGLAAVSGDNSLRAVLQVLAAQEGLNLAEVGRRIGRPNGQVHGYLKSLLAADLLFIDDKRYYYSDPILRFFVSQNMFNNFVNLEDDDARIQLLARRFFEEFILKRPDLGFDLEFRIKLLTSFFDGHRVDGEIFGARSEVVLPQRRESGILIDFDESGKVAGEPAMVVSDLCLIGHRRWMVEIHRGEDLVEVEDLELIQRKRRFFESRTRAVFDRLWVISEAGFTEECRDIARASHVLISEEPDIESLEKHLFTAAAA